MRGMGIGIGAWAALRPLRKPIAPIAVNQPGKPAKISHDAIKFTVSSYFQADYKRATIKNLKCSIRNNR